MNKREIEYVVAAFGFGCLALFVSFTLLPVLGGFYFLMRAFEERYRK